MKSKEFLLLVSGATKTVRKLEGHPNLGALLTPAAWNLPPASMPFAVDNSAFSGFDEAKFVRYLHRLKGTNPIFVAAPDVVGDAIATAKLFREWQPRIKDMGFKVALVMQDGQEAIGIPWNKVDALFVGGSTEWKLGQAAEYLVRKAANKGMWVHMGRVNSSRRMQRAREWGCRSCDGSGFSIEPGKIAPFLRFLETEQLPLDLVDFGL